MFASEPTASNTIQVCAQEPPFIKFPPFPEPPSGVTIMPFKGFKPRGIQLFSEPKNAGNDPADEEDVELDALGIPTVELRVKHATDECKSNTRKKRKKKKTAAAEVVPVKKLPWYEEWEEGEDLRVTKVRYDPSISPVDRFYQSAYDFRTGRPWPSVTIGLNALWDQFRLFTGLLVNPSGFRKAGAKDARVESPDFDDDDDDDDDMNVGDGAAAGDARPAKRQRSGEALDPEDQGIDPQKLDEEMREEKITNFLCDPEKAVRIFLSSYMREQGLIWTERNLVYAPRLIYFFLAFVLRNGVLPEPVYQRGLKRALNMIERAKKELPLTLSVGRSIPDSFNEACRECFDRQGGINWSFINAATNTIAEKNDATITVTDVSSGAKTEVILPSEAQIQLKDAIEDNIDVDVSVGAATAVVSPTNENTADDYPAWGASWGSSWANEGSQDAWAQSGSWGDKTQGDEGTNSGAGADTQQGGFEWHCDFASLLLHLGPSTFPLTHTTGIIECSTRRVSVIHFPPTHPKGIRAHPLQGNISQDRKAKKGDWMSSADGVEAELEARFAKVILEPWGREEGDISAPEIWRSSRGAVIDPTDPTKVLGDAAGTATRKPHDPRKDNITLLVVPSFAETLELVPGLGLGAMWIEIVRQKSGSGTDAACGAAEVDDSVPGKFWYHEDVTGIFPSYYTPRVTE